MSAQAISDILAQSAAVKLATAEQCSSAALAASQMIATALQSGGKLMLCGNGGSAGDAQHLAGRICCHP
jgi:D-sedoheptulose 7-phosphate isomerase